MYLHTKPIPKTSAVMNGGFMQCSANYVPLSPISFLERAAVVHGDKPSVVYGSVRYSWKETHQRCRNFAAALVRLGISRNDIVAAIAPNIPALYELHFSVPMAGAVLCALNTRLDSPTLSLILQQLEAKLILVDYQHLQLVLQAFEKLSKPPLLILIPESDHHQQLPNNGDVIIDHALLPQGTLNYDDVLQSTKAADVKGFEIRKPHNECDAISVNYTSGSTGNPKGVVYSHRATYLNSIAAIFQTEMTKTPVFLWTVDMFRCNGWCYPWAVAALGGTNVCLRRNLSARLIFEAIDLHNVTHFCGSPCILNILAYHSSKDVHLKRLRSPVHVLVAGVLPATDVLRKVADLGFEVSHGYGMTEALGPAVVTPCRPETESCYNLMMEEVDVKNPSTMESVPYDGKTMGHIMFRGNTLMLGYLKNSKAENEPFKGGWYMTGDIGIRHEDGYIQMKDRARDMIVCCGGEVVSTLEVEAVLLTHPSVSEAAVVGRDDDCLGKTPCAFVKLKQGCSSATNAKEIIGFCGERMEGYMVPKSVVFGDLPLNSTGKIQKFVLREKANKEVYGDEAHESRKSKVLCE